MRLIDADTILKDACCYCDQDYCGMVGSIQECKTLRMLRDVIDDTPTAYDVDNVVKTLENEKNISGLDLNYLDYTDGINEAIKIVKEEGAK